MVAWGLKQLYPSRCVLCDEVLTVGENGICRTCRTKDIYLTGSRCMKCGKKLLEATEEYCLDCKKGTHLFKRCVALYDYEKVSDSLYRLKYGKRSSYADFFGEEIAFFLEQQIRSWKVDAIVPVPMYRSKERKRGYNQATCIAKKVGRVLKIPVLDSLVVRNRNTIPLKNLNPGERRNNLKNAFHIVPFGVKLDNIIIMDDIYTTGSTVDEIARVLLQNGCKNVYVITLAIGNGV